jgi:hypothetical protein
MENFIYVFSEESKEKMLDSGYSLIQEDAHNGFYIFLDRKDQKFSIPLVEYAVSHSLAL